jgi:hypothetical protein
MAADLNTRGEKSARYVDRQLLAGSAALMAVGLATTALGATVGLIAAVTAGRRYVAGLQEPPREIARRRWGQARSATAAGVGAWQHYSRPVSTSSS